ncbi:Mo-dependent nitrogenase C-terminal domain-containing protein [Spirulina sp. 06S082]|uniref:Mo-dependent nitrogenase C-terminal domain-containing protein n=1 Tax=Spirulina sp. 06S082 TaxID=3110248 RepID=UPI002B217206|nr:Mo-dependent nitrogenase C-terminal domain-containing protein [Spirulina sp. 06S082]MEA5467360.1 Mo-dependent nitrogenase C-terminal domain-containing protein [Spirulina sp. 06S082]
MTTTVANSPYTDQQIAAWLRGLLTIAWADGHFDPEEQELIAQLTQDELAPATALGSLEPISPQDLAAILGGDRDTAENFIRTAVMMALANGVYSLEEAKVINEFLDALGLEVKALKSLEQTLYDPEKHKLETNALNPPQDPSVDVLAPVRDWLEGMDMKDPRVARFVCKMVPPQCPFERDIKLFGHKIVHIPPMCKLNPLYDQLVGLRFRALTYLADDCEEDVSKYC